MVVGLCATRLISDDHAMEVPRLDGAH
jgi:hypothetical protein